MELRPGLERSLAGHMFIISPNFGAIIGVNFRFAFWPSFGSNFVGDFGARIRESSSQSSIQ
jgi:hypothetical protein